MSLFTYLFDSDWRQRGDIEDLKKRQRAADRGKDRATRQARQKLEEVEADVGELALYCRTAVTLLIEKGLLTREEFMARMREIDASDGSADGRYTGRPGSAP